MIALNKNEFGQLVFTNLGQDISAANSFTFILEPQRGKKLERTVSNGVVIGTVDITVGDERFLANQYLQYTILEGDLDYVGAWRLKGEVVLSSTNKVINDFTQIEVRA